MLYFVPAWYQQNTWNENEQIWYAPRTHTEFDDTVKQIQLFHRNKVHPYQILLLAHAPNFRHFLHRQSVYHAPYWSCFDAILQVSTKKARVFSFHDLNWPEDVEFLYTPFVIVALRNRVKYAQIEFGEDGNMILVDMFENGILARRNIYDDRGFVSCTELYQEGRLIYKDYLMENAVWKLREYVADGHVEINPECPNYTICYEDKEMIFAFSKLHYEKLDQVIEEVLEAFVNQTEEKDIFCVAMHKQHLGITKEAFQNRKLMLSLFQDRLEQVDHPDVIRHLELADYVITDSKENSLFIQQVYGKSIDHIKDITPFDTRVDFGISQQLSVQKILVPVDDLGQDIFVQLVPILAMHLEKNKNAKVCFFTRKADFGRKNQILDTTKTILEEYDYPLEWAMEDENRRSENDLETGENSYERFVVEQCVDELAVSKCMREQRLVADLRLVPELYLQVSAVSNGIPQIVRKETQFLENKKNGLVVNSLEELPQTLDFYLDGMQNWNEAMVFAYEIGKKYTTGKLLTQWREVIETIG